MFLKIGWYEHRIAIELVYPRVWFVCVALFPLAINVFLAQKRTTIKENNRKYLVLSCSFVLFFPIYLRGCLCFPRPIVFMQLLLSFILLPALVTALAASRSLYSTLANVKMCNFLFYAYAYINVGWTCFMSISSSTKDGAPRTIEMANTKYYRKIFATMRKTKCWKTTNQGDKL